MPKATPAKPPGAPSPPHRVLLQTEQDASAAAARRAAMPATRPDFFIHSGDTIYADGPIAAHVTEPDGQIWRNLVTEEVSKVAESLNDFRGRHRYNLMDRNVRAMYAEVPVIAQWDDHETTNNWYPGEILNDARYTERRVDVLAARGRQAWQEYQ